jgi:hypothetical protein
MQDTMKKPRQRTPSAAKRARSASGADEGDRLTQLVDDLLGLESLAWHDLTS